MRLQPTIQKGDSLRVETAEGRQKPVALEKKRIADIRCQVADVRPVDIAERRIEVLLDVFDGQAAAEALAIREVESEAVGAVVGFEAGRIARLNPRIALDDATAGKTRIQITEVGADN